MQITIISDCHDDNVVGRQKVRAGHLFDKTPVFVGVSSEIEAAGNIIDILDALDGEPGVILANVAPRDNAQKKNHNGTPFGYFWIGKTLVVSTVDGLALSLVKKFGLTEKINVLDTEKATEIMINACFLDENLKERIVHSQFRSFDFLPRIAAYIWKTRENIGEEISISQITNCPKAVWHVDNFGNCKTTVFKNELEIVDGVAKTFVGNIPFYQRLKEVPLGQAAVIVGSSGIGEQRFLEIVVQGVKDGSASRRFSLKAGSEVF